MSIPIVTLLAYAFSGALGLVYEVAWARRLSLAFGGSQLATASALVAFMGGLALGARFLGRRAAWLDRPLRTYARLEIAIGIFGLASPWIIDAVQWIYLHTWPADEPGDLGFSAYRFVLMTVALLFPTMLMGATVPAITEALSRAGWRAGGAFGIPFGLNTAGAMAGTATAGFLLIPLLGVRAAILAAGAGNILLGVVMVRVARQEGGSVPAPEPAPPSPDAPLARSSRLTTWIPMIAAAVTGACGMGLEIAWTRLLGMVVGSTTYAFTSMLAIYLLGLAIGGLVAGRIAARTAHVASWLAISVAAVAAGTGVPLLFINELPYWFLRVFHRTGGGPMGGLVAGLAVSMVIMLVPAVASGMVLPFAVALAGPSRRASDHAGRIYAANTAAGIMALILVAFVTIPHGSIALTLRGGAGLLALCAGILVIPRLPHRAVALAAVLALAGVAGAVFAPPWQPTLYATAVYRYARVYENLSRDDFNRLRDPVNMPILWDRDGATARVTVIGTSTEPSLLINGKGASGGADVPTEVMLAQLPIMMARTPRTVLVIGQGGGITSASALVHPDIQDVIAVEVEPRVLACRPFFRPLTLGREDDPRLKLVVNDGRNYLTATRRKFDVIASQPSHPWVAGAAALFTREAYAAGRDHLAPGGVFCQWLQTYECSESSLRTMVRTFASVFAHCAVFVSPSPGDLFLVGSQDPLVLDPTHVASLCQGAIGVELRRGIVESPAALILDFCFAEDDVVEFGGSGPLNTDDNAYIEFHQPFDLYADNVRSLRALLLDQARGLTKIVRFPEGTPAKEKARQWRAFAESLASKNRTLLSAECLSEAMRFE